KNLEAFVAGLLEIGSIRDIRLASKALMGLPQHWLQDDVVEGMTRLATTARERDRRAAAGPVLRADRRRLDHALLLLPLRHDPERRALATVAGRGADAA